MIYVNEIENRITFKIKSWYYLELLTSETMRLLRSTKSQITKNKNSENVLHLKIAQVVLIYCNIVKSIYHHDSRVLYTFVPNRSYGQFFGISPKYYILKNINSECSYFEVWFTDQNCKPIEIEDKINTTLVIN